MCGRYTLRRINLVKAAMDAVPKLPFEEFTERPRFNIAPSQPIPIVRLADDGNRVLQAAKWGLIPSWTVGKPKAQPINARFETLKTSRMFRQSYQQRRCLVPADGFYEWKGAKAPKQPYFIHLKNDDLFAFAGIWERWRADRESEPLDTVAIITTTPNELVRPIHDRMPAMLRREDFSRWLKDGDADLLKPYPADEMEAYPVSSSINRPTFGCDDKAPQRVYELFEG